MYLNISYPQAGYNKQISPFSTFSCVSLFAYFFFFSKPCFLSGRLHCLWYPCCRWRSASSNQQHHVQLGKVMPVGGVKRSIRVRPTSGSAPGTGKALSTAEQWQGYWVMNKKKKRSFVVKRKEHFPSNKSERETLNFNPKLFCSIDLIRTL